MNAGPSLAFVLLSFLTSSLALAEDGPPADRKTAAAHETPAAPGKGLVVFVDPVTGKIRQPEPAEIGALTAPPPGTPAKPAAEPPLVMKSGPGGSVGVVLDSRYESFMVVTKRPDGTLATECVSGGRSADAAVATAAKQGEKKTKEAPRVP